MAIQDSDLLLINRAGASYKVAASNLVAKVQSGDLALVNRSGSSYKLTGDKLTAGTFNDTDLFIVNRAGASYQVAGSEIKTLLIPPVPLLTDVSIARVDCGNALTCFDIEIKSNSPMPTDITVRGVPRVFAGSKTYFGNITSDQSYGFLVTDVGTGSQTPINLYEPSGFSSDNKTAYIRMSFGLSVNLTGEGNKTTRTLFGDSTVMIQLLGIKTSSGNESNKITTSQVTMNAGDWS